MLVVGFSNSMMASKKKSPGKMEKKDSPKMMTGELKGKITKDKQDFKKYVLLTADKKMWAINASAADKVKRYYNRTVKLQATYYTKDGKNIIEKIAKVSR